jgi:diguanylate cyclase (GGDEF)-like protein
MIKPESIDSYGDCDARFQPSMDDTNDLLAVLGDFNRDFAMGADTILLFDGLLSNFLRLTNSEYGFLGERLIKPNGQPFLKTHAITNVAWDEETLHFYKKQAPDGLSFDKEHSLFGHVIYTGNTLISNDPGTDPRAGGIPEGHPALNSFMGIPLILGNNYLGMLGIANRPGGYDAGLLRFIRPLINITVASIHAAQQEKMARHDPLTGLANRRKFDERFLIEYSRHNRHNSDLSLLLIDIDHFKNINDTFGHPFGDHCLVYIAKILSGRVRTEDIVVRYGGEEFAVLLPDTSAPEAVAVAKQLCIEISNKPFVLNKKHEPVRMTVSIGVVSMVGNERVSYEDFMDRADKTLYTAKNQGRNQVFQEDIKPALDAFDKKTGKND